MKSYQNSPIFYAELQRVLGHPTERTVYGCTDDEDEHECRRCTERSDSDPMLSSAEGDNDERHLETFEEDPVERNREAVSVERSAPQLAACSSASS